MSVPTMVVDLEVDISYGQVYLYGAAPWANDPSNDAVLRALDDARTSGRFVGVADGLVDFVSPVQYHFGAPLRLEIWPAEPPAGDAGWDHVVDVDIDIPAGQLHFEGSGGREPFMQEVPRGTYRGRLAGRGYEQAVTDAADGMDSYQVQLWPRNADAPPTLRKGWPGWQHST
jgi:hypothetical protein